MASFGTKLRKAVLLSTASLLLLLVFIVDVIRKNVAVDIGWITFLRSVAVLVAFLILYVMIESRWGRQQSPAKKLGFALVVALAIGVASGVMMIVRPSGFDIKNGQILPLGFDSIVWANIFGVVLGAMMLVVLLILRDIILSKRRKGTRRNFIIFVSLAAAGCLSTLPSGPLERNLTSSILLVLAVVFMVVNSFRLSWIVYLSKREKIYSIIYGFLLLCTFIGFDIVTYGGTDIGKALLFYSVPLQSFIWQISLFATIYFGMTFISTLFHLPTSEAFDRKVSEVSSLNNLSRLVTQVFDFNELVDSVTTMTLEVCEAKSSWLEVLQPTRAAGRMLNPPAHSMDGVVIAARKNITPEESSLILPSIGDRLRSLVVDQKKPLVIDSVRSDRRTKGLPELKNRLSSMAVVPLLTHERVIGILYATKDVEYGFDRDDVEVISAFADQAAIAIENSRLIETSLERERLMREMMLAQDMQRKLLPQQLPALSQIELEALSTPAFEVGGDYYDFALLDDDHLAVLVGDVSGKGVSAAFYMAEMKGIFQSLSKIYRQPREFLAKAHETLVGTIDKRSFISLLYAVIDLRKGTMSVARAGHCPLLFLSGNRSEYVKPTGLGLGMGTHHFFARTILQQELQCRHGDVAVFYTDGVTEAHRKDGEEFGYEKLQEVVQSARDRSAVEIRDAIIMAVDAHMGHESPEDDLTIVVMKWMKKE